MHSIDDTEILDLALELFSVSGALGTWSDALASARRCAPALLRDAIDWDSEVACAAAQAGDFDTLRYALPF
jgi:hypothetical protein